MVSKKQTNKQTKEEKESPRESADIVVYSFTHKGFYRKVRSMNYQNEINLALSSWVVVS